MTDTLVGCVALGGMTKHSKSQRIRATVTPMANQKANLWRNK